MMETFYKIDIASDQMYEQAAYVTLELVVMPPASFAVIELQGNWSHGLSRPEREVTLWTYQSCEADSIREYSRRKAVIQKTRFSYAVERGK